MVKRIAFLAIVLLSLPCLAVQTLLTNEMFQGVGTLTNGTIGSFDGWNSGAIYKRAVGPRTAAIATPGWSGDPHLAVDGTLDLYYSLATWPTASIGSVGCWIRFNDFGKAPVATAYAAADFIFLSTVGDGRVLSIGVKTNGVLQARDTLGWTLGVSALTLHTWYYVMVEWDNVAGAKFAYRLSTKPLGGVFTTQIDVPAYDNSSRQTYRIHLYDGISYFWGGRVGAFSLCSIGAIGDGGVPASIIDPVEGRNTWYVNPATGSDSNAGNDPGSAWASSYKLTSELAYSGVLGTLTPWVYTAGGGAVGVVSADTMVAGWKDGSISPNGDRVLFDTSSGPLYLTTTIWAQGFIPGIEFGSATASRADIRGFKILSSPYTQYDPVNFPNIWYTADTATNVVLWEDRKWPNAITNTTIAMASTNLNNTPGSFFNDSTNMYFHPFGSTDPNVDGKVYERSRLLTNITGAGTYQMPLRFGGESLYVHDLSFGGSTLLDHTNRNLSSIAPTGLGTGRSFIRDCDFYYNGNHDFTAAGSTDTNAIRLVWRVQGGQGPAYAAASAFTTFVEYCSDTGVGRQSFWHDCIATNCVGVIGSAAGTTSTDALSQSAWYSHTEPALSNCYSRVELKGCKFTGGPTSVGDLVIATNCLRIASSELWRVSTGLASAIVDECRIHDGFGATGQGIILTNCLALYETTTIGSSAFFLSGNCRVENCTLDARSAPLPGYNNAPMISSGGTLTLLFRNNVVYAPDSAAKTPMVFGIYTANTMTSSNNVYKLEASLGQIAKLLDGAATIYTLATWQAAGYDANSVNQDPCLSTTHRPYAKTPCWNIGVEVGPALDFTGKLYQSRRTCGAYEYKSDAMLLIAR